MAVITENRKSQVTTLDSNLDQNLDLNLDQNLSDRLSIAEAVLHHKVQQEGFELGIRCSSKLTDADFRHFDRVSPIAAHVDEDALDYLWTFLDFKGYPTQARLHDRDFAQLLEVDAESRILFAQSWVDGVLSVWRTVQESINSNAAPSALTERLETEKIELLHRIEQEGFELGIRSSSTLSTQDFRHFQNVKSVVAHIDEDALDALWTFLDFKGYPQQARFHHPDVAQLLEADAQSRIIFVQSWVEAVLSVWQGIQNEIQG